MQKAKSGVVVTFTARVYDILTGDEKIPQALYEYHLQPLLSAYAHPVLLKQTVDSLTQLTFVNRVINQYSKTSKELEEYIKAGGWTWDFKIDNIEIIKEKENA